MQPFLIRTAWLVLLCLPLWGFDNAPPRPVEIFPHWNKGEKFELTITRAREKSFNGQSTVSGKTRTGFTIEVLRADDEGYLVGWTAGETIFDVPAPSSSFLRQVVGLMQGMQIILEVNPYGAITGVQNWEKLRSETLKMMDTVLAETPNSRKGITDTSLMSQLRAQWETMFSTKAQVEQSCTRDARIYFMALGRGYTPNKPYTYDDLIPNPLGGDPFPAHATIALKSFDKPSGHAVLMWNHMADPHQAARILESMIKDLAARRGKASPEGNFAKTITVRDNAEIVVDVNTGWVQTLTHTQSVTLGTRAQTDKTSFVTSAKR